MSPKKSEASVSRDDGGERAQHLGREVLPFVNDYVAIAAFPLVGLKLVKHRAGEVAPVVRFATELPLTQVARIEIEKYGAISSRHTGRRSAYALHGEVALLVRDTMLLNPLKLLVEEFYGTLQNRASYAVVLRLAQRETNKT